MSGDGGRVLRDVPTTPACTRAGVGAPPTEHVDLARRGEPGLLRTRSGAGVTVFATWDDVQAMLVSPDMSSSINAAPPLPDGQVTPAWFFGLDGREHQAVRAPLVKPFSAGAAASAAPWIRDVVRAHLPRDAGGSVDLVPTVFWPVSVEVAHVYLGTDPAAREPFEAAMDAAEDPEADDDTYEERFHELWRRGLDLVANPAGGVLSDLAATHDAAQLASVAISVRMAACAPLVHFWGWAVRRLILEPGLLDAVRAAPGALRSLVDELLRLSPSNNIGVVRVAERDTVVAGTTLADGALVLGSLVAANRDPRRFHDADDVNADHRSHLAFGAGRHRCVGQFLARVETEALISELFLGERGAPELIDAREDDLINDSATYGLRALEVALR